MFKTFRPTRDDLFPADAIAALAKLAAGEVTEDEAVRNYARIVLKRITETPLTPPTETPVPQYFDRSELLSMANEAFNDVVDWDLRGSPITSYDVLLWGSYGPAVARLANLAVHRQLVRQTD